ncbi:MAG: CoA transferase [Phenylobacterium sp.]|uniref:CoA transferase n=1 Tax=Phenylobacterium sp. TaxID=1871053 RepID=UPI001A437D39|nr:CoA transferase [Phenylobacterium sp.]MBL8771262.1 CoA transferase [Phenylobacterium sp.]
MKGPIGKALRRHAQGVAEASAALGREVDVAALGVTDRDGELPLGPAGELVSPNGACRMFRVADGWMALNLAREEDRDLVPAWLGCDFGGAPTDDPWDLVAAEAPRQSRRSLIEQAMLLGLPACGVAEIVASDPEPLHIVSRAWAYGAPRRTPKVVDLSALWAGPLCGAILAAAGCEVTKVESVRRPDPTRTSTPGLHARLNGGKAELALDLADAADQAKLRDLILDADAVITSARPRGLRSIGLDPEALLAARRLTWVAITGYGLSGAVWSDDPWTNRVGFGDDTAAAGGLVAWTAAGEPRFRGDALADPVTGVAAAASALRALAHERAGVIDAGMAPIARRAAIICGQRRLP